MGGCESESGRIKLCIISCHITTNMLSTVFKSSGCNSVIYVRIVQQNEVNVHARTEYDLSLSITVKL